MLRQLNKIAGSLVAFILYPLVKLIAKVVELVLMLLIVPPVILILPIMVAIKFGVRFGFINGILKGMAVLPSILFLAVVGIIELSYRTIHDVISVAIFGLSDGYTGGLFFHVLQYTLADLWYEIIHLPIVGRVTSFLQSREEEARLQELEESHFEWASY